MRQGEGDGKEKRTDPEGGPGSGLDKGRAGVAYIRVK